MPVKWPQADKTPSPARRATVVVVDLFIIRSVVKSLIHPEVRPQLSDKWHMEFRKERHACSMPMMSAL